MSTFGVTLITDAEAAKWANQKGAKLARRRFQQGSLFKSGKRQKMWVARWWEDAMTPGGSKRVRKAERLGLVADLPTRRKAAMVLAERLRPINSGIRSPQSMRKFSDFVSVDWKPVVFPTLKQSSQTSYEYQLDAHLLPALGELPLREITRERIQQLLDSKLAAGLSHETVRHTKFYLSKMLGCAEDWGYIAQNPARKAKLPRRRRRQRGKQIVTPQQLRKLLPILPEPARTLVLLLTVTGLRIGEALALRWRNVDFGSKLIRVDERLYDGEFDDPKTEDSVREHDLAPAVLRVLKKRAAKTGATPDALVFATRTGRPLDRRTLLRRQFKPACKKLGMNGVNWHTLRHTYVTAHDTLRTPLGVVQDSVGHVSDVTRRVYLHSYPSERRAAAKKLENFFIGPKWTQVLGLRKKR